jgi:MFS transporter, DHA1 family, tetracycline resistance protein
MSEVLDYESGPDREPPKGALRIIFFIVFMDLLGFGIIIPLLPFYAENYRASALDVGLLFSVYSACQFIAAPILGAISDRFGRRPVLVFSQLGSAVGYLLLGLVMQVHWAHPEYALALIFVSRLIDGLSGGNISAAQAYVSDVTTPATRARGMGVLGAAFGIGFAVGPALGAALSYHPAWPGYAAALMSTGAMLQTFFRLPESRVHIPAATSAWLHPSLFGPIFRHRKLVQLLLIAFFSMSAFVMLESMAALALSSPRTFDFKPWQVGLYFAYIGVVITTVQGGLIGRLTKKFGEWPLAIIGAVFVAIGMGLTGVSCLMPVLPVLLIGGLINATGRSLQTPTLYALISHNSERSQQGLVFGLNQGLASIARVIGPILAAGAFRLSLAGPFLLGAAIVSGAAVWTVVLRKNSGADEETDLPADARAAEAV